MRSWYCERTQNSNWGIKDLGALTAFHAKPCRGFGEQILVQRTWERRHQT